MGDIADMMIEGLIDEETGEYIGDANMDDFGIEAPGFPRSLQREHRTGKKVYEEGYHDEPKKITKLPCPICGKKVKPLGLSDHIRNQHSELI